MNTFLVSCSGVLNYHLYSDNKFHFLNKSVFIRTIIWIKLTYCCRVNYAKHYDMIYESSLINICFKH